MTIWSSGYKVKSVTPLEPDKAMKDGAEFVGEAFVLTVSAGIVVWEFNRSSEKQQQKAKEKRERIVADQEALNYKLRALDVRLKAIEDLIKEQQSVDGVIDDGRSILLYSTKRKPKYRPPPDDVLKIKIVDNDNDTADDGMNILDNKNEDSNIDKFIR